MCHCALCLFLSALSSKAELIDHFNPRWQGAAWQANSLHVPGLAYQAALFPLISQGPGTLKLPGDGFILRLHILPLRDQPDEAVLTLWGRVTEATSKPLATLWWRQGKLVWVCTVDSQGDSLFDASKDVELISPNLTPGCWANLDLLADPLPYEQTFGWNLVPNQPEDPAKPSAKTLHLARQLSVAGWILDRIEMPRVHSLWFGQFELLPPSTNPVQPPPNILRK